MAKVLQLQFKTASGKNSSLSIDTPKENLTNAEVNQVMNTIISNSVFEIDGSPLSEIVGARYVERTVTEIQA